MKTTSINSKEKTIRDEGIAGIFFFIQAAQFITVLMISASIVTPYDFNSSAISDFGVYPSTSWLFNISMIIIGLFNIIGGYFYFRSHEKVWIFIIFIIAGLSVITAGLFPLNTGDIHSLAALIAFLFFNIELFVCGILTKGLTRIISFIFGIIGLIFVVIMIIGDAGNPEVFGIIGHGGAERMIVYPVILFLMYFGGYLSGQHKLN